MDLIEFWNDLMTPRWWITCTCVCALLSLRRWSSAPLYNWPAATFLVNVCVFCHDRIVVKFPKKRPSYLGVEVQKPLLILVNFCRSLVLFQCSPWERSRITRTFKLTPKFFCGCRNVFCFHVLLIRWWLIKKKHVSSAVLLQCWLCSYIRCFL